MAHLCTTFTHRKGPIISTLQFWCVIFDFRTAPKTGQCNLQRPATMERAGHDSLDPASRFSLGGVVGKAMTGQELKAGTDAVVVQITGDDNSVTISVGGTSLV